MRLKEVKTSVKGTAAELMEKSTELLNLLVSQDSKLDANSNEIKEALAAHREDVTNQLIDVRDSIDTYTLSASIGTDIGTVEAGISLKSLTEQLRELVQHQLARERVKLERHSEPFDTPVLIQKQMKDVKEENRNNFAELTVALHNLNTKLDYQKDKFTEKSFSAKTVPNSDLSIGKYDQQLQKIQYWSTAQTIASVVTIASSLILIVNEFSK